MNLGCMHAAIVASCAAVCSPDKANCFILQVLQGAVDVVMEALRQIEAFEEAVQAQEMASARGDRSIVEAMTAAQACAKLQKLISQARLIPTTPERWSLHPLTRK